MANFPEIQDEASVELQPHHFSHPSNYFFSIFSRLHRNTTTSILVLHRFVSIGKDLIEDQDE
jgi:hypothetical protein